MKTTHLRLLGFLGLLGLSGFFTGNYFLFGFFGFLGFFAFPKERNDEMLGYNLGRAGLNAFVVSIVGFALTVMFVTFFRDIETAFRFFVVCVAILFAVQILTFVFSFQYYETKGNIR